MNNEFIPVAKIQSFIREELHDILINQTTNAISCEDHTSLHCVNPLLADGAMPVDSKNVAALSRVFDYKHHWSDCLAGSLLGSSAAAVISYCCRKQHIKKRVDVLPLSENNVNQTQSNSMSNHMGAA
uniref:AcidPPc domain-containing protein n=1 Tax=Glossina brevipalpis TaxID=37001 RepID=A0A1A9WD99_9MUSC